MQEASAMPTPAALNVVNDDNTSCIKLTPPQFNEGSDVCGKGAYCFVIDVSGRSSIIFFAP